MIPTTRAYALQLTAATLYAAALAPLRERYERAGLTELTVIGGTLIALAPAAYLARTEGATWKHYERWVAAGFVVTSIPITVWQAGVKMGWWR